MSHSKTKFNIAWLKKIDGNGHLLEWWCHEHKKDKFVAVCRICEKDKVIVEFMLYYCMQAEKFTEKKLWLDILTGRVSY